MGNPDTLGMAFGAYVAFVLAVAFMVKAARTRGPQMPWFFGGGLCTLILYRGLHNIWPEGVPWVDQLLDTISAPPIPRPSWLTAELLQAAFIALCIATGLMVLRVFGLQPSLKGGGGGKSKK